MTTQHAKSNAREGGGVGGLPPLPESKVLGTRPRDSINTDPFIYGFTAEQMHAYALAAMQAQQGAEPKLIAYSEMKPTADPDVFEHHLWMLAPGMEVPAGCTPLYYYPDGAPR